MEWWLWLARPSWASSLTGRACQGDDRDGRRGTSAGMASIQVPCRQPERVDPDARPGHPRQAAGLLLRAATALFAEMFPTNIRSTGMSVSFNIGVTVFGGFAPLILT